MLRDASEALLIAATVCNGFKSNCTDVHHGSLGGNCGGNYANPCYAQPMIEESKSKVHKYEFMSGDYYQKRARTKANQKCGRY